jgi:hypothetical protein
MAALVGTLIGPGMRGGRGQPLVDGSLSGKVRDNTLLEGCRKKEEIGHGLSLLRGRVIGTSTTPLLNSAVNARFGAGSVWLKSKVRRLNVQAAN